MSAALRRRVLALLAVAVLVAACGAGAPGGAASAGAASGPAASSAAKPNCAALKKAASQLAVGVQLLAQMRSPQTVEAVKDKVVGDFDPDTFIAALQQLHAVDSPTAPLGNPKTAIDNYIAAAQSAKTLLAKDGVTQADVDAYLAKVGTISDFVGGQAPISAALSAAGCS